MPHVPHFSSLSSPGAASARSLRMVSSCRAMAANSGKYVLRLINQARSYLPRSSACPLVILALARSLA
eukprot:10708716-Alexandrium_andersonii.AAC.1